VVIVRIACGPVFGGPVTLHASDLPDATPAGSVRSAAPTPVSRIDPAPDRILRPVARQRAPSRHNRDPVRLDDSPAVVLGWMRFGAVDFAVSWPPILHVSSTASNANQRRVPMRMISIGALMVVALGTLVSQCILLVRLREHRHDLRPHEHFGQGTSPVWQVNVFRASNYSPAGRRLLRRMGVVYVLWFTCLLLAGGFFMGLL
jgi:hypothetical protein